MSFEILDHTADVKIKFYGSNIEQLLSSFTEAWVNLTSFILKDPISKKYEDKIEFNDQTDMLYRFASLFIEQLEGENFYINRLLSASMPAPGVLSFQLVGYCFSEVTGYSNIPKAPTYHEIYFDIGKGYGQIIMDL
ncbi:MAG: archease [Thermoplasmataceae archaeon]